MSEPMFDSRSPRHELPYLFPGQAQKEGHVNEALARIDALLHMLVEGAANVPPSEPGEGTSWLIGPDATGDWAGRSGQIATLSAGNWIFFSPRAGMHVTDRVTGQCMRYRNGWQIPARPDLPTGGTTADTEARAAISAIVDVLTLAGLLAAE